ncbi:MAG: hypothetical protein KDC11_00775 [Chitinophagaceae bacterium]|nr:hypothetical protein [Chitinophagaceae bacterium]
MSSVGANIVPKNMLGRVEVYILLCFLLYGFASQYLLLSLLGGVVLIILLKQLWRPHVPPVLLYLLGFHWLQVFFSIVYADFVGVTMDRLYDSHDTETLLTITLVQIALMAMLLSRFVNKTYDNISLEKLRNVAYKFNVRNLIVCYIGSAILLPFILSYASVSASVGQLVRSMFAVKSLFLALLFFILLLRKTKYRWLIIGIFIADFLLSFASFFSDFKQLIILVVLVYFTLITKLKNKNIARAIPAGILLVVFLAFWSHIKVGYRSYLNQGTNKQVVAVSSTDALSYLFDRVGDFNFASLKNGATILLSRIQYMERYSEVYKRVPSVIEHQGGRELEKALTFIFVPRILNANKGINDVSVRTSYFTGKRFSTAAQGTSISMGYFCDLYIDYGLFWMFLPLIGITILLGYLYQYIISFSGRNYNVLFNYSLMIAIILNLGTFESDIIFFLGMIRNNTAFLVLG